MKLTSRNGESIQEQLRRILNENSIKLIDLFREWDDDGNGALDKKELRQAVASMGYEAPKFAIDALFDSIDTDKSGWIEFHEFKYALSDKGVKAAKLHAQRAQRAALNGKPLNLNLSLNLNLNLNLNPSFSAEGP